MKSSTLQETERVTEMSCDPKLLAFLCDREATKRDESCPNGSIDTCFCPSVALEQ